MTDSSSEIDWGGSAFPCEGGSDSSLYPDPGMSMRDYFAAQAIVGISTWAPVRGTFDLTSDEAIQSRAVWAYRQADAMIEARRASPLPDDNGRAE